MEMAVKSMETAMEAMELMETALGTLPRPGKVPEQKLLSPKIGLRRWRRCGTLLRDAHQFRVFASEALYMRRGNVRGQPGAPHLVVARPGGTPAPPYGVPASWPPSVSPSDFISCREKKEVRASFRPIPRIFPV
jgi:hypothetical protein